MRVLTLVYQLITNVGEYPYSKCPKKSSSYDELENLPLKFREATNDDSLTGE